MEIAKLKSMVWNPPTRTAKGAALNKLTSDITQYNLMGLPVVTPDGLIVDGHRRIESLKAMGYTHVECIIYDGLLAVELFTNLNEDCKKMAGEDWTFMRINDGERAIPARLNRKLSQIFEYSGKPDIFEIMLKNHLGPRVYDTARQVMRYIAPEVVIRCLPVATDEEKELFSRCLNWVIIYKQTFQYTSEAQRGLKKEDLWECILHNKPLSKNKGAYKT
jgi:hypothetical protein